MNQQFGFSIRAPAGWSVNTFDPKAHGSDVPFDQLRATDGSTQVGIRTAGIIAVFAEPPRSATPLDFSPTITIAVRDIPDDAHTHDGRPSPLSARSFLLSLSALPLPSDNVQPLEVSGLSGATADFRYSQETPQRTVLHDLSGSVVALLTTDHQTAFLFTVTAPSQRAARYRKLFQHVVRSFTYPTATTDT